MKLLNNIINKINPLKNISEINLINDEIKYFEKKLKNQKASCLSNDIKYSHKLNDLHFIKDEISKNYKKFIISKLNEFPLNKFCTKEFICDKINISLKEFDISMFNSYEYNFLRQSDPIIIDGKSYYHSGVYDGVIIIVNDNDSLAHDWTIIYKKVLSEWKVIDYNNNYYYKKIK